MFITKYIDSIVYDYIYPWEGKLASFKWAIRSSYHHTLGCAPGKSVFVIYVLFNLISIVDWRILTARKFRQVDVYNVQENARQVRHDYTIGDLVIV